MTNYTVIAYDAGTSSYNYPEYNRASDLQIECLDNFETAIEFAAQVLFKDRRDKNYLLTYLINGVEHLWCEETQTVLYSSNTFNKPVNAAFDKLVADFQEQERIKNEKLEASRQEMIKKAAKFAHEQELIQLDMLMRKHGKI